MRGVLPTRCIDIHSNNNTSSQGLREAEDRFEYIYKYFVFFYLSCHFHVSVPTASTVAPLRYTAFCIHVIIVNFETPDSVVGMTTRCGLNGPQLEPQCG